MVDMDNELVVFWFRRDLRLYDNNGLYRALKSGSPVLGVFIFDSEILGKLDARNDARVSFIYGEIKKLKAELELYGSSLRIFYARPTDAFNELMNEYKVKAVFVNKDYEPYSRKRDNAVKSRLKSRGSDLYLFKDHVMFDESEVLKDNGEPYTVFTPYSKKWKKVLGETEILPVPSEKFLDKMVKTDPFNMPDLHELGFRKCNIDFPSPAISKMVIQNYAKVRDFPSADGTTRLGLHLRFGIISVRELTLQALNLSDVFLNELIWREFFSSILWHFPHVEKQAFKSKYNYIHWRNNENEFERWCNGQTGYPFVDAGMRELNATGFMHNRMRMVTAGFLTKHLLIDWRWGEAYFAIKLLDFDLASNNGNWQWVAGTGCDAVPYFRIFNPLTQQKKFDMNGEYVRKWVPELDSGKYPLPVVDHSIGRERALKQFKLAANGF